MCTVPRYLGTQYLHSTFWVASRNPPPALAVLVRNTPRPSVSSATAGLQEVDAAPPLIRSHAAVSGKRRERTVSKVVDIVPCRQAGRGEVQARACPPCGPCRISPCSPGAGKVRPWTEPAAAAETPSAQGHWCCLAAGWGPWLSPSGPGFNAQKARASPCSDTWEWGLSVVRGPWRALPAPRSSPYRTTQVLYPTPAPVRVQSTTHTHPLRRSSPAVCPARSACLASSKVAWACPRQPMLSAVTSPALCPVEFPGRVNPSSATSILAALTRTIPPHTTSSTARPSILVAFHSPHSFFSSHLTWTARSRSSFSFLFPTLSLCVCVSVCLCVCACGRLHNRSLLWTHLSRPRRPPHLPAAQRPSNLADRSSRTRTAKPPASPTLQIVTRLMICGDSSDTWCLVPFP